MSSFRFDNLAGSPGKSCNVIDFRDVRVMIDCPLDFMSTLAFMPLSLTHDAKLSALPYWNPPRDAVQKAQLNYRESRQINYEVRQCHSGAHCIDSSPEFALFDTQTIDIPSIDVVLISNYLNMFGLPYLTERLGLSSVIYVTEPTYHFGRIMMEEMIQLIERTPRPQGVRLWKKMHDLLSLSIPKGHLMDRDPNKWLRIFTMKELNSCLSKLKVVNFSQSIDIFGLFEVSAHSSGFCIGSCNWTFKSNHEKIVYMSQTSLLTTHPKPFEIAPLQGADVMLLTNLTPSPLLNPETMFGDLFSHTIQTLKNDGNVLIPCHPCGIVYDLIECIAGQLTAASLTQVPIYFISPVAESSLAYSNILGEWLTSAKQSKVFIPDEPFIHSSLVRAGRLKHFSSVNDPQFSVAFKCPCVVLTSHPSLRFGDVVHFLHMWGQSSRNMLILTEPDYPCQEAVNPYLPLAMRILYSPIDTNWNFKQANNLLGSDLRPTNLILHSNYVTEPPSSLYNMPGITSSDLMIKIQDTIDESNPSDSDKNLALCKAKAKTAITPYAFRDTFQLQDVKAKFERLKIDCDFAAKIVQNEIKPGLSFATVNGLIMARDNRFTLLPLDNRTLGDGQQTGVSLPPDQYYFGSVNIQLLLQLLAGHGIFDATVEGAKAGKIIELRSLKAVIHIEESQTHIITADQSSRMRLRELVTSCLRKF